MLVFIGEDTVPKGPSRKPAQEPTTPFFSVWGPQFRSAPHPNPQNRVWSATVEILIVTPEIAPYSGRTELGALAAALPKGLRGLEHHVVALSPLYGCVDPGAHSLARRLTTLEITLDGETQACVLYDGRTTGGIDLLFIGHPGFSEQPDDLDSPATRRTALILSQAAAALAPQLEPRPEVVHAFGFQAALSLPLIAQELSERPPATILSPYALTEQGQFDHQELLDTRPAPAALAALDATPAGNLLGTGLRTADRVVMGSQAGCTLLLDSDVSRPLQPLLAERPQRVTHVHAGLDSAYWNPLTDSHLTARYDAADTSGKTQCRSALQYELGLPARHDVPLFGVVGTELLPEELAALTTFLHNDAQVILALAAPVAPPLKELQEREPTKVQILAQEDPGALHRLVSGTDILWLPEATPRGSLWHLRALRYGAIPIASQSGPAAEVLVDCDAQLVTGNGFLHSDRAALLPTLQRAAFASTLGEEFERLRRRAMRTDVSWERAARRFEHLYRQVMSH